MNWLTPLITFLLGFCSLEETAYDRDTFDFSQGDVIKNQPMAVSV